ncbi:MULTISPECIES: DUF6868 family protein [Marinobacter]|uniref:DUF6868 domain-containing protein n=1 Tax=Marinobacter xiaoshiensis TaxID=3073652 RepID=A0ABU2HL97_9GAMM|nr:hypothetical protein [Marinobacter sp. F60267]MDS1311852.1 hypothetical protein [Marinobacter sp. F60267]
MMTISQLTELLGWASILNLGMLIFAGILLIVMKPFITSIHSRMFGIPESELATSYFNYLANYKIFSFVFIIAPYLALKIMGH